MTRRMMLLHSGNRITHQTKRHMPVRRRLMFNQNLYIAVPG